MASITLVVMAAGLGSRYGGLKQIDPVGPNGEIILDYSVYDALRAGFDKVVFIIRRDIEAEFRLRVGRRIERRIETAYVLQELDRLPAGFQLPAERRKPWGTGHAILLCKDDVTTPFAAVNADDLYGREPYEALAGFLRGARDGPAGYAYAMAGYILRNTLSEFGHVARAVCRTTADHCLADAREILKIQMFPDGVKQSEDGATWLPLDPESIVSLNFWGFTPSLFGELEARFPAFLEARRADLLKAEFLIPEVVGALVREGKARVRVLPVCERWHGVTYPEDKARVETAIRELIAAGIYPEKLW